MRKIVMNWKLYFILGLLGLCAFFVIMNINVQTKQPSEGWSRAVKIAEVMDSTIKGSTRIRVYPVAIEEDKKFIVFWNENEKLKYIIVNNNGKSEPIQSVDLGLDEPQSIYAYNAGKQIALYVLERGRLSKISYDPSSNIFSKPVKLFNGVNSFKVYDNLIFVATDNGFYSTDSSNRKFIIDKNGAENFDIVSESLQNAKLIYKIAYTKTDNAGTININFVKFEKGSNDINKYNIGNFVTSVNETQSIESLIMGNSGNRTHVIVPCRNLRSNSTRTIDFNFVEGVAGINDLKELTMEPLSGYNPDPVRISDEKAELRMLSSVSLIKGNRTETYNIREFMLKDNKLVPSKYYTNMNKISKNHHYFKIGSDEYLQWENSDGAGTKILFASTNGEVINLASGFKFDEQKDIILDSLMALGFALSYILLIFSCIMMPTLVFVIIAAVFFLNWVEAHPRRATGISILFHVIAELILTSKSIMQKPMVLSLMPNFMQSGAFIYGTVIAVAALCYICTKLKYRSKELDKSFINQYAFFAIMNMILYALVFFPYYYI